MCSGGAIFVSVWEGLRLVKRELFPGGFYRVATFVWLSVAHFSLSGMGVDGSRILLVGGYELIVSERDDVGG